MGGGEGHLEVDPRAQQAPPWRAQEAWAQAWEGARAQEARALRAQGPRAREEHPRGAEVEARQRACPGQGWATSSVHPV